MDVFVLAIGAAVGGVLRYELGLLLLPYVATVLINLIGSFLLVFLSGWLSGLGILSERLILAITTGMIGAFTTFSTFSLETIKLFQTGHLVGGIFYVGTSLLGGLLFAWLGWLAAERLVRRSRRHQS